RRTGREHRLPAGGARGSTRAAAAGVRLARDPEEPDQVLRAAAPRPGARPRGRAPAARELLLGLPAARRLVGLRARRARSRRQALTAGVGRPEAAVLLRGMGPGRVPATSLPRRPC